MAEKHQENNRKFRELEQRNQFSEQKEISNQNTAPWGIINGEQSGIQDQHQKQQESKATAKQPRRITESKIKRKQEKKRTNLRATQEPMRRIRGRLKPYLENNRRTRIPASPSRPATRRCSSLPTLPFPRRKWESGAERVSAFPDGAGPTRLRLTQSFLVDPNRGGGMGIEGNNRGR